jgi:hypothetical protein
MTKLSKFVSALLGCAAIAASPIAAQAEPQLGVYRWDSPSGPANVDAFSQWLGKPVEVAASFEALATWDDIDGADWQLGPWSQWVRAKAGRNISLGVPMLPKSGASLAACASGTYDTTWTNLANNLAMYGLHWAYLRLGWEMDGTWYTWNAAQGSGKEASFAGCFRRIVQTMRQAQPANQWKFVLNTTTGWRDTSYLNAVWPGDAYVDVVAIDFYDQSWAANTYPYPAGCDATCRQTRQQNAWNDYSAKLFLLRNFAAAHGKPLAFPEWGVAIRPDGHGGGDNPFYIQKMYDFIRDPANNVAYHSYWDVAASDLEAQLTGATKFPQSAALFKKLFSSTSSGGTNTAPTVSVTSPASGQTVSGTVAYAANATDNAGVTRVEFFVDGASVLNDVAAPYAGSLDTTKLANGTHALKAVAYDAQGLNATSQVSINVQNVVAQPSTGPTGVTFLAPAVGGTISGSFANSSLCQLTGTGITRVVFSLDGTALNTETASPWNCSIDTRLFANGTHTLKGVAFNAAGASTTVTRSVNVQNGPSGVGFLAPATNGTISGSFSNSSLCQLTGTGINRVVFFLDSTQLNTETTSPWNCSIDTRRYVNGTHTLKAIAYDASGAATTVTRTVNVSN